MYLTLKFLNLYFLEFYVIYQYHVLTFNAHLILFSKHCFEFEKLHFFLMKQFLNCLIKIKNEYKINKYM